MAFYFSPEGYLRIERRSAPRYGVDLPVEVTLAGDGTTVRGLTRDVSESGLQLVIPGGLPEDEVIDFACARFSGRARAIWRREVGGELRTGLQFLSLSDESRTGLLDLIGELHRQQLATRAAAHA